MPENIIAENRVRRHTSAKTNERISRSIDRTVTYYSYHPDEIEERLEELRKEWDIERILETNASTLAFTGVVLGALFNKKWLLLSAGVTAFLFQHGVQGWCPPVPFFRRGGVRTGEEIMREYVTLKAVRGDFDHLCENGKISQKDCDSIIRAFKS